jgi:hypothetical protein
MSTPGSKVDDTVIIGINRKTLGLKSQSMVDGSRYKDQLTSPTPRPGMFPPTLNGNTVSCHVVPISVDRKMEPGLGSHSFVYMPTARYKRLVSTGSVARASIPQLCLITQNQPDLSPLAISAVSNLPVAIVY